MLDLNQIRPFLEASPNAYLIMWADKPHFTIVDANSAFCEITLTNASKIIGASVFDGFMVDGGEHNIKGVRVLRDCLERALLLKKKQRCALQRFDLRSGERSEVRFWSYEIAPLLDEEGEVRYLLQHVVDVTGSVLAEAEEKTLDPLIEAYPDAVGSLDLNGNFLSANKALLSLTECSKEELLRRSFIPFIARQDFSRVFAFFQKSIQGELQKFEANILSRAGNTYVASITTMPIKVNHDIIGVQFIARNISNLRIAEKQLELYHQRMSSIIESIRDGFFAVDRNSVIEYWNLEAERLFGIDSDQVVGQNLWHVLSTDLIPKFYSSQQRVFNERIAVRYEEYSVALQVWLEVAIFPSPNGLSVYLKDISERMAAERALEASEQRFKALVQNGSDVISIIDRQGNYQYMSPSSKATLGVEPGFWVGRNVLDFVHPEDKDRIARMLQISHTTKQVHIEPFRFMRNGSEYRWIETVITDMTDDPAVGGLVTNTQDVTDRVEYVRAIEEQNKRLREIAFIQSHMVRAPLMRIKGLSDLICNYEKDEEQVKIMLRLMSEAVEELDHVIQDIIGKTDNL